MPRNTSNVNDIPLTSKTSIYQDCLEKVKKIMGVDLVLDPFVGQEFCFHKIYQVTKPKKEKGIKYPSDFRYWKVLPRERLAELEEKYIEALKKGMESNEPEDMESWMFLAPVFIPDGDEKQFKLVTSIVKRLLKLEPEESTKRGICIKPSSLEKGTHPRAFLPDSDWFEGDLRNLKIEDILTILPPAEQKMYALSIGRVVVGASDTIHLGTNKEIKHSWRTAPVITGLPGIGKSTLTMSFIDAIKTSGYSVAVFKDLNGRFGIGEIVASDLAYADDLNQETFIKYIKSPIVKQAITGGEIKTEKKFLDEVTTKPTACFISNINDFNVGCTYGTDDGVLDRIKILNTRRPTELEGLQGSMRGFSKLSPNLHPIPHYKYLCEKLNCSQNALFLKFASLCAHEFMKHMNKNELESEINKYATKLEVQLHKHYDKVIAMVFQLSFLLVRKEEPEVYLPDLKPSLLGECTQSLNFLVNSRDAHEFREAIKNDWKEKDRPSYHPWTGIKLFDQISVENAASAYQDIQHNFADKDLDKCIKTVFTALRLNQGYNVPANTAQVIQSWDGSKRQIKSLIKLAKKIRNEAPKTLLTKIQAPSYVPDTKHIRDVGYDRQIFADKLNEEKAKSLSTPIKTQVKKPSKQPRRKNSRRVT